MMNLVQIIRNKKFASIALLLLVMGMPILVIVALKQQELRSKAAGDSVQFQLSPADGVKNSDSVFSVDVNIDAGKYSLSGVDTNISIDKDFLDFVSFEPTSAFDQILNSNYSQSTGILRITLVDVNNPASIGVVKIGTITLRAKAVGTGLVSFSDSQVVALGESAALPASLPVNGAYSILVTHQDTPIPTDSLSPIPTNVPTSTPIPSNIPSPTFTPTPAPLTLKITKTPTADTFVKSSSPNTSFGKQAVLETDTNPNEITYMKFNLADLVARKILKATLVLKVGDGSGMLQTLRFADENWAETMTYNKRPILVNKITTFKPKPVGSLVQIDVTNQVRSKLGQNLSLGITSAGDDKASYYSRESAVGNRPQLIIEYQ